MDKKSPRSASVFLPVYENVSLDKNGNITGKIIDYIPFSPNHISPLPKK